MVTNHDVAACVLPTAKHFLSIRRHANRRNTGNACIASCRQEGTAPWSMPTEPFLNVSFLTGRHTFLSILTFYGFSPNRLLVEHFNFSVGLSSSLHCYCSNFFTIAIQSASDICTGIQPLRGFRFRSLPSHHTGAIWQFKLTFKRIVHHRLVSKTAVCSTRHFAIASCRAIAENRLSCNYQRIPIWYSCSFPRIRDVPVSHLSMF